MVWREGKDERSKHGSVATQLGNVMVQCVEAVLNRTIVLVVRQSASMAST
jgi:hypothetical protein